MEMNFKKGMYVRGSVDYEDDKNPRMFAIGRIKEINRFEKVTVQFIKSFRSKKEEIIYDYIPDEKEYACGDIERCFLLKDTICLSDTFGKMEIIELKEINEEGYYEYYVKSDEGVTVISENRILVDFTRGYINPIEQMKNYEFHNPFWYGQRLIPSEILNILDNIDSNFKTLISSRAYLFEHQIDTIVRTLKEDKIRLMFADEVGLGKTIESLVVLKGKKIKKALIIVPNSLVYQWKNEISVKLWMDGIIYNGEVLKKGIHIISFEDLAKIDVKKLSKEFDFCIIDEAHKCLYNDKLFEDLKCICENIKEVILLSATPIQDRKDEYLKLLQLLKPEIYSSMSKKEFTERYNKSIEIRKIVYRIARDLQEADEEVDEEEAEEIIEEIIEDLEEILIKLDDAELNRIVKEIDIDNDLGKNKIREALAYISENYQFEKNIIRHRRKELQGNMANRDIRVVEYEMQGSDSRFYEQNVYEIVLQYLEHISSNMQQENTSKLLLRVLNSMLSSHEALRKILEDRLTYLRGQELNGNTLNEKEILNDIKVEKIIGEEKFIENILSELIRWGLAEKNEVENINEVLEDPDKIKSRLVKIIDFIDQELYNEKIVIFTGYTETLNKVQKSVQNFFGEEAVAVFSQLQTREESNENVTRFQNDEKCKIMICDESGGEGRNFQMADCLIHYDLPISPIILEQRIGRLDRIGRDTEKAIENIVIYAKETLEEDLLNIWNEGLDIFKESLSGLEIALDSINTQIREALIGNIRYGLTEILPRIKENLIEMREVVKEERYYDMSRQLDSRTKERYKRIIKKFDDKGGEVLATAMLKWCRAVGLTPKVSNEEYGQIMEFDESSLSYKAMKNTMFDIPNTMESIKRGKSKGLNGTFDRDIAIKRENLTFFAPGENIFESIMKNVKEAYRGSASAIEGINSKVNWEGFIIKWNAEFEKKYLIESGLSLNYQVYSNGHMPIEQIVTFASINDVGSLTKEGEEYVLEYIKENYSNKRVVRHIGKRSGSSIENFKNKYKNEWNTILEGIYTKGEKSFKGKYELKIDVKKINNEFKTIIAGEVAAAKYLNKDMSKGKELEHALEKVEQGIINPYFEIDSIIYVDLKRGI